MPKVIIRTTNCVDATVNVNGNLLDTVPSGGVLDVPVEYENGTPVGTIVGGVVEIPNIVKALLIKTFLEETEDFATFVIDADGVGTITSITQDGGSGVITVEVNAIPVSVPITLVLADVVRIDRTISTADGFVNFIGTYV